MFQVVTIDRPAVHEIQLDGCGLWPGRDGAASDGVHECPPREAEAQLAGRDAVASVVVSLNLSPVVATVELVIRGNREFASVIRHGRLADPERPAALSEAQPVGGSPGHSWRTRGSSPSRLPQPTAPGP